VLKVANAALRFKPAGWQGPGGRGTGQGQGGQGGGANGGMRHSFASLLGRIVPDAYAQEGGGPGGPGGGPGANDPYVKQVRDKVQKGELTREQAHEMIRKHFDELGVSGPGGPPPGGPGGPGAPPPGAPAGARGAGRGAPSDGAPSGGAPRHAGGGATMFGGRERGTFQNLQGVGGSAASEFKPGGVFVLKDGKPVRVRVMTGLSDGMFTEVKTDSLKEGELVVTGLDNTMAKGNNLTPPPGMGGPGFRGPGGRR
jgi:hypothetical protein